MMFNRRTKPTAGTMTLLSFRKIKRLAFFVDEGLVMIKVRVLLYGTVDAHFIDPIVRRSYFRMA